MVLADTLYQLIPAVLRILCTAQCLFSYTCFLLESFPIDHNNMSLLSHRSEFPMILVANKNDLETDRVVSYQEGEELAITLKVIGWKYPPSGTHNLC